MKSITLLLCYNVLICESYFINSETPSFQTTISRGNLSLSDQVDAPLMPHHLYIGRCSPEDKLYHQQNFILNNTDDRIQASTNILIKMDGSFRITCVKVIDQMAPGVGAYPYYRSGGVGEKFVSFDVISVHGRGFRFHVQIYGRPIK